MDKQGKKLQITQKPWFGHLIETCFHSTILSLENSFRKYPHFMERMFFLHGI